MEYADGKTANADKLMGDSKLPVAVLAKADGTPINRIENTNGKLKVADVEKLVDTEMKQRKTTVSGQLKEAADKVKAGDKDARLPDISRYLNRNVCFPRKQKKRRSN
jgi:hypothetical protein